jgi:hypothetical protein
VEFFRVIAQNPGADPLPIPFSEAFASTYNAVRDELRARRRERDDS